MIIRQGDIWNATEKTILGKESYNLLKTFKTQIRHEHMIYEWL